MSADLEFEKLVKLYYRDLYRFGFSLTGSEADAADLTQETFLHLGQQRTSAQRIRETLKGGFSRRCIENFLRPADVGNCWSMSQLRKVRPVYLMCRPTV